MSPKKRLLKLLTVPPIRSVFQPWTYGRVPVLMLHRVCRERHVSGVTTNEMLESCVRFMVRVGLRTITLRELSEYLRRGEVPARRVCLTFDDGYGDFHENAFPILKRHGMTATVLLGSDYIEGKQWYWWDRVEYAFRQTARTEATINLPDASEPLEWRAGSGQRCQPRFVAACKGIPDEEKWRAIELLEDQLGVDVPPAPTGDYRPLTWDEIRELAAYGIEFGGHTVTHPILSQVSDERAEIEIVDCLRSIEEHSGIRPVTFAYPNGRPADFTPHVVRILQREGIIGAATTVHGFVSHRMLRTVEEPMFRLPRLAMPERMNYFVQTVCGLEALKERLGLLDGKHDLQGASGHSA